MADDYFFLDQARSTSLPSSLFTSDPLGNYFRPVSRQFYFALLEPFGSPSAFHLASLLVFLFLIAVYWRLIARMAGGYLACLATAFLALHYAPEVAVRWASGIQDLLATTLALASMHLYLSSKRTLAALTLLLALLSKETVLLLPLLLMFLDRSTAHSWATVLRRALPLGLALLLWLFITLAVNRHFPASTPIDAQNLFGAMLHLAQVALAFEWQPAEPPSFAPLSAYIITFLLLAAALIAAARERTVAAPTGVTQAPPWSVMATATTQFRRGAMPGAAAWCVLGTVPLAPAMHSWSAYQYLFALCGVALLFGTLLSRLRTRWTLLALAYVTLASAHAASLDQTPPTGTPWTPRSRVSPYYLDHAARFTDAYMTSLKTLHPRLPSGAALFFDNIEANTGFQMGDGPLVRWMYADSSLRSYFIKDFSRSRVQGRATYFFTAHDTQLYELDSSADGYYFIALALLLNGHESSARELLQHGLDTHDLAAEGAYLLAWLEWEQGEQTEALALLSAGSRPVLEREGGTGGPRDSSTYWAGVRVSMDPRFHAAAADTLLSRSDPSTLAIVETYASRVLAPTDPLAWRRWAAVLLRNGVYHQALSALERYRSLAGHAAASDTLAMQWLDLLLSEQSAR